MSGTAIALASDDRTVPAEHVGKIDPNYYCRGWNEKRKKYCRARAGERTTHSGRGRCYRHGGQRRDGDGRIRHGARSTVRSNRIQALIEQHAADPNLLDVSRTLATAKALMDDFIDQYYEITPALLAWFSATEPITEEQRVALLRCLEDLETSPYAGHADANPDLELAREAVQQLAAPRVEKPHQVPDISEAVRHADIISKIIHRVNQHHSQSAVSYARLATFMFELGRELDLLITDRVLLKTINERILRVRI